MLASRPVASLTIALSSITTHLALAQGAAAEPTTAPVTETQTIQVKGHYNNAVGSSDAASQGVIGAELLKSRPALRPGEVLEFVPGVIVTQHSGDGKANQYFLRGFNLDHGTDFATSVNGMPVNMPSNGHGQGYTDLNFLIPELVQRIEYRKGPYFARGADFASAGSADIVYRTRLDEPFAQLTLGQGGYRRGVVGASTEVAPGLRLLPMDRADRWSVNADGAVLAFVEIEVGQVSGCESLHAPRFGVLQPAQALAVTLCDGHARTRWHWNPHAHPVPH